MSDFTDSMIEAGFWDPEEYMDYLDEKCSDTYEQDFEDAQYDWPEDECYDDADSAGEEDGKQ